MANNLRCNEVLYDNILDENTQGMFLPFHLIQIMFLLPRYRIYKNFVTYNSTTINILSSLGCILPCGIFLTRYVTVLPKVIETIPLAFIINFDLLFHLFGFIMAYTLNLTHKKLYMVLLLNIQRIFKMFKYNKYKDFRLFNLLSWLAVSLVFIVALVAFFVFSFTPEKGLIEAFVYVSTVYFDFQVIFASRVINIVKTQLNMWISELKYLTALLKSNAENEVESDLVLVRTGNQRQTYI